MPNLHVRCLALNYSFAVCDIDDRYQKEFDAMCTALQNDTQVAYAGLMWWISSAEIKDQSARFVLQEAFNATDNTR